MNQKNKTKQYWEDQVKDTATEEDIQKSLKSLQGTAIQQNKTERWDDVKLTAINPNDYLTITRESFISKYGKAAERLIKEIEVEAIKRCLEALPTKAGIDDLQHSRYYDGWNEALTTAEESIKKLDQISQSIK